MWVKQSISILARLRFLKNGIEWLPLTYIDSYDHESKKWHVVRLDWIERFDCFVSGLDTAICGYVYVFN